MSKTGQVFAIGALIRLVLPTMVPLLTPALSSTVELSTPMNSFKSLQEAFYYLRHGIDLYDGGLNHHAPLLVVALSFVNDFFSEFGSRVVFNFLYTAMDLGIAWKLILLNKWYNKHNSLRTGRKVDGFNDDLIASFYLLNPLMILSNLSHSTLSFPLFLITESLFQLLVEHNLLRAVISLAVASYLSYTPVFLIVPLLALGHAVSKTDGKSVYFKGAVTYALSIAILLVASYFVTSSWKFLDLCYGAVFRFDKIQPNLGLWWYLFTEMFNFFTPFYVGIYNLYSAIFIVPITLRLFEFKLSKAAIGDSFLAFVLSYLWLSFTRSYPTVGDLGFGLSLLPIFKGTVIPRTKFGFVAAIVLLVSLMLSPTFYYCWIVLGNGNSNFFYSINLSWGAVHVIVLMDLIWGRLVYDYIETHGVKNEEQENLRLTQI